MLESSTSPGLHSLKPWPQRRLQLLSERKAKQPFYFPPSALHTLPSITLPPNTQIFSQIWGEGLVSYLVSLLSIQSYGHYACHLKEAIQYRVPENANRTNLNITHIRHLNTKFFKFRHFGLCHTTFILGTNIQFCNQRNFTWKKVFCWMKVKLTCYLKLSFPVCWLSIPCILTLWKPCPVISYAHSPTLWHQSSVFLT